PASAPGAARPAAGGRGTNGHHHLSTEHRMLRAEEMMRTSRSSPVASRVTSLPLLVSLRVAMLALVTGLILLVTREPAQLSWVALLTAAALPATLAGAHRWIGPLGRLAEVLVTTLAASEVAVAAAMAGPVTDGIGAAAVLPYLIVPAASAAVRRPAGEAAMLPATAAGGGAVAAAMAGPVTGGIGAGAVLPYLTVPAASAAVRRRAGEAAMLLASAAVALTAVGAWTTVAGERQLAQYGYVAVCVQWLLLASLSAVATGALHRTIVARFAPPQPSAAATRLLTQLRSVARRPPG